MGVSANTLFHFTQKEFLKKILLSRGFIPKYSKEKFGDIVPEKSIYRFAYIPMVSFCDLTIMQLHRESNHKVDFGKYGIGLKKTWGMKKKVSPLTYVHNDSQSSRELYELIKMINRENKKADNKVLSDIKKKLIDSFKFLKPYEGNWHKGSQIEKGKPDIIYYNQREWRYCPTEYKVYSGINEKNETTIRYNNIFMETFVRIDFEPTDIKFIIIDKKTEIDEIVDTILKMDVGKEREKEIRNLLITKIITAQELEEDY